MRIVYLAALAMLCNALTTANGHAGNSSSTLQFGTVNVSGTNRSGGNNDATSLQFGATNGAAVVQSGGTNTSVIGQGGTTSYRRPMAR